METKVRTQMTVCGFCSDGNHDRCCRAIRNGIRGLWYCRCEVPGCGGEAVLSCVDCKKVHDDVDPKTRMCIDQDACYARIETARHNNGSRFYEMGRIIKENKMTATAEKAETRAKKVKEADCTCGCGGKTKGGKFLPGHDARFVSQQVEKVLNKTVKEADARKATAAASDSLGAKFDKSLALAQDRLKKAAEAKAEKEKAKAEKAAETKKAAATKVTGGRPVKDQPQA